MPIRLIIFDFDGTLADTRDNIVRTIQAAMRQLGLPVADESACADTIGLTLRDAFAQLYPDSPPDLPDRCVETYREIFSRNKHLLIPAAFPHVHSTLRRLWQQGVVLTVASSRAAASLHEFLGAMGLSIQTLRETGVNAAETLVVGDMPMDILMGRNAGTFTCGVTYGNATRERLQASGAHFLIDDIAELLTHDSLSVF